MKTIFCLILIVVTWGESVEAYWNLMRTGRYDEAAAKIETYLNEGRRVSEAERVEGADLVQKAQTCQEMKASARNVVIVDSVKVSRYKILEACVKVMEGCRMKKRDDGGSEFVATRGNKRLMSVRGDNGFDLYRQYGNDEKERLSDNINTRGNEIFPFEMSDGVTIYFASDGHGTIGGYDLFTARYDSETFDYSEPKNVGMPFNSLGNDYLMMEDEIAGLGLWATDWRQSGDTVVVYVYKLGGDAVSASVRKKVELESEEDETMRFVVNDTLIYTDIEKFRSAEARGMYLEMKEMLKEVRMTDVLLESMRKGIDYAESDEEQEALRQDILDNERYVLGLRKRLREMVKTIRQLEIKRYE